MARASEDLCENLDELIGRKMEVDGRRWVASEVTVTWNHNIRILASEIVTLLTSNTIQSYFWYSPGRQKMWWYLDYKPVYVEYRWL